MAVIFVGFRFFKLKAKICDSPWLVLMCFEVQRWCVELFRSFGEIILIILRQFLANKQNHLNFKNP